MVGIDPIKFSGGTIEKVLQQTTEHAVGDQDEKTWPQLGFDTEKLRAFLTCQSVDKFIKLALGKLRVRYRAETMSQLRVCEKK